MKDLRGSRTNQCAAVFSSRMARQWHHGCVDVPRKKGKTNIFPPSGLCTCQDEEEEDGHVVGLIRLVSILGA